MSNVRLTIDLELPEDILPEDVVETAAAELQRPIRDVFEFTYGAEGTVDVTQFSAESVEPVAGDGE